MALPSGSTLSRPPFVLEFQDGSSSGGSCACVEEQKLPTRASTTSERTIIHAPSDRSYLEPTTATRAATPATKATEITVTAFRVALKVR